MFDINALIKFINTNGDDIIQKSEIEQFQSTTKSNSVFSDYLNSVNSDVSLDTFSARMINIEQQANEEGNEVKGLEFNNQEDNQKFNKIIYDMLRQDQKDFLYRKFSIKFSSREEFEQEIINVANSDDIEDYFNNIKYTKPINIDIIRESGLYNVMLPDDLIFDDIDWSNSREVFDYITFNEKTFSQTLKEHLPEGYNPQQVFDKGKSIGLGIEEAHNMGYTGRGIGVAICDWQLKPHKDLNIKEYNRNKYAAQIEEYFHASAVAGILAGQQTGIAPDSDVYFYAEYQDQSEDGGTDMIDSLQSIIDKNKELPDNNKIRVVSISGPIYGDIQKTSALIKELTNSGVWVLSAEEFWLKFGYLSKKDPMGDNNDFNNYQIYHPNDFEHPEQGIYVNSGDRTIPSPFNETAYIHDSRACASWAIPAVAGYYTLACQADPEMTPERFYELATKTARIQESTNIKNPNNYFEGRTEEIYQIKIIDIKALLEEIEKEKNN